MRQNGFNQIDLLRTHYRMTNRSSRTVEPEALTESKILRDKEIGKASEEQTRRILNKVKQVFFALWNGTGYLTLKQVAEFYEVGEEAVRSLCRPERHKAELEADGVKTLRNQELKDAPVVLTGASKTSQLMVFPIRAVLRVGFILRDSEVARQVRDVALNIIEGVGRLLSREILQDLLNTNPPFQTLVERSDLKISAPLAPHWDAMKRNLKKLYPNGGISGWSTKDIQNEIASLSTRIDIEGWEFRTKKELCNQTIASRTKYPDFSITLPVNVEGRQEKAIFMFLFDNLIINYEYVEECAGRNYLKLAKNFSQIEYAFLFFVAPFGATPDAEIYLQQDWPAEKERGFVGVLTVKELAELLINQGRSCKRSNLVKGEIYRDFKKLFDYQMPDPLLVMMGYTP
jgi:hypothetical protein